MYIYQFVGNLVKYYLLILSFSVHFMNYHIMKTIDRYLISIFFLLFSAANSYAQTAAIDSLENLLKNHPQADTTRVKLLLTLDKKLFRYDIDKTMKYANEIIELADKTNYLEAKAKALNILGACYYMKSDFSKAIEYFEQSLEASKILGIKESISDTYNNIGAIYKIQGNYPKALEYFQKSLTIEKELGHKAGVANTYNNIGIVYDIQKDFSKALDYYLKALKTFQELGDESGISDLYHNIGINYLSQGNYIKALEYFEKSFDIYQKNNNKNGIAWSYFNMGIVYREQNNYDKALDYFQKTLKLSIESGNKSMEAKTYKELSLLYLALKDYKKTDYYAKKAYAIAQKTGDIELMKNVTKVLAENYANLGQYKKAYQYHVIFKKLNDSLFNENNIKELTRLEMQYKYEKEKEAERLNQKKKEALLAKELEFQKTLKYILLAGLLISILIIALIVWLYRIKKKANKLLIQKNKEIMKQKDLISKQNSEIQAQSKELTKHKRHLEELVEQRTADLMKAKEKAEESDRLKTAFLNNVSHEFRTPMNGIMGFASILNEPGITEEARKNYVNLINKSCSRLLNIVNDTVEISKVQSNQEGVFKANTNVKDIVNDVLKDFKSSIVQKNIEVELNMNISDEEAIIKTDEYKLKRIIWHLLSNAVKFTFLGKITLAVQTTDDNRLQFLVEDTGIGIPSKLQKVVFEPFRQAETNEIQRFGGNGIGLTLSKAYIEMLGGRIWIESKPEQGTTVFFTIPIEKEKVQEIEKEPVSDEALYGKTILVAEDNELNYLLVKTVLADYKINMLHAWNGKEAVDIFSKEPNIDLILMDMKMPVMDGYEATRRIKKIKPSIPVVALTAYSMNLNIKGNLRDIFDNYISKPVTVQSLIQILKKSF